MRELSTEALFNINGGDKEDYDLGYKIGHAARLFYYKAMGAWHKIFG